MKIQVLKLRQNINVVTFFAILTASLVLLALVLAQKLQARPYGSAGCGVGMTSSNSKARQMTASSTNQTFSQLYSVTSGTSGCGEDSQALLEQRKLHFVKVNHSILENEIVQGGGETLDAFTQLMGCSNTQVFQAALREDSELLLGLSQDAGSVFLEQVNSTIQSNAQLANSCQL